MNLIDDPHDPFVLRSDANGVARLTMNRPQSRNALSQDMIDALQDKFDAISGDPAIRAVVLCGAGPAFCAGHDLKEMRAAAFSREYSRKLFADCSRLMQRIVSLPQPVIACVHGVATAAGLQLVATCDLAVASEKAHFATPGVNIGLFCSTPMVALSRNVAHKHAMQLLLTGDLVDAETALRMGLVNEVVSDFELDDAVAALAGKIAAKPRLTVSLGKAAFYRQAELPLEEAYDYTSDVITNNLQAQVAQEGIAAFIDKRVPLWSDTD